jgi:hypothetical protein
MQSLSVRSILRLGIGLLAPVAFVAALAGPAAAQLQPIDPAYMQVQYMPQDGAAIVFWNKVDNATGYNVYEQTLTKPGSPSTMTTASTLAKVNTTPIPAGTFSYLVPNLKNGTAYHFAVSEILNGQETEPVGPRPAVNNGDDLGDFVAVVPQKPVNVPGISGDFYGYNIGTDVPGSHTVDATGKITMQGSGWDIQNNADGEYFLATQVKGDITVTARLVSGPTATANESTWNLGGPQIRASLDAGAPLAMTQAAHNGKAQFKYRLYYNDPGAAHEEDDESGDDPSVRPIWLRVSRKGNDFSGALSKDNGKTWAPLDQYGSGGVHTIRDMPATAYVGLALAAHDDGQLSTAVFDSFTITSP